MKRNVRWVAWAVLLPGLLVVSTVAQGAPLPAPSTDVSVTNLAAFTAGTVVNDTGSLAFSFGGNTGTVREWVVSNASTALCAGCLSFVYQVQVTGGSVGRVAGSPYDAFTVDVSHFGSAVLALTGSVNGIFGANNADRDASGNTIDFDYTSPITSTFSSFLEIANTNATASQAGTIAISAGVLTAGSQTLTGFAPGTATGVPEPATILLLGSSLVALGVWRRRS
jgi:PEP-CTERM motif